jgi:aryl-alcohol dehydrogenase-like predicted oxidoreductase
VNLRAFGKTDLHVSEIGFGTWGLGGDAYGPIDEDLAVSTLRSALECGVNFYDTADLYGLGRSERLIGTAFEGRRDHVIIATKCGMVPDPSGEVAKIEQDFSPTHINESVEKSLKRLQTDFIDLLQLHSPELSAVGDETIGALERLREQGKIRYFGISVRDPRECRAALAAHSSLDSIQVNFSLVDQRLLGVDGLDACRESGAAIIVRTPLCFGYLTGDLRGDETLGDLDHRRVWPVEQRVVWSQAYRTFLDEATDEAASPAQFALRYCLSYGISTAIPGMMSPDHVTDDVQASVQGPFPPDTRKKLEDVYQQNVFYVAP